MASFTRETWLLTHSRYTPTPGGDTNSASQGCSANFREFTIKHEPNQSVCYSDRLGNKGAAKSTSNTNQYLWENKCFLNYWGLNEKAHWTSLARIPSKEKHPPALTANPDGLLCIYERCLNWSASTWLCVWWLTWWCLWVRAAESQTPSCALRAAAPWECWF